MKESNFVTRVMVSIKPALVDEISFRRTTTDYKKALEIAAAMRLLDFRNVQMYVSGLWMLPTICHAEHIGMLNSPPGRIWLESSDQCTIVRRLPKGRFVINLPKERFCCKHKRYSPAQYIVTPIIEAEMKPAQFFTIEADGPDKNKME